MIREASVAEYSVAVQIHSVAQAAYALEAERIGCAEFPPLRESLDELRESTDRFLVFQQSERIIGALSFDRGTDSVTVTRLVVSPLRLRQGIASALLYAVEQRLSPNAQLSVSTAETNAPALLLYQRLGYIPAAKSKTSEGIPLLHLVKSR